MGGGGVSGSASDELTELSMECLNFLITMGEYCCCQRILKVNKTGVINDPLSQPAVPEGSKDLLSFGRF